MLLMHQKNCQQGTHMSTWQPVARGQQLLALIEVCPLTPHNSPLPPSTETECQLSFIILHSAHLFTYISCPAWVNMDCATPDLRPSSDALGSKFQYLSPHHILIQKAGPQQPWETIRKDNPRLYSPEVFLEGQLVSGWCFPFLLWTRLFLSCFEVCFPAHWWSVPWARWSRIFRNRHLSWASLDVGVCIWVVKLFTAGELAL